VLLEIESYQKLFEIVRDNPLADIYKELEKICKGCEQPPMSCFELCRIWEAKNEFIRMNGFLFEENYLDNLFNAVKNDRRRKIIEALSEHSRSIKGLQAYLKTKGYYHSRRTIASTYVEPLVKLGVVKEDGNKHRLTLYGRKFKDVLSRFNGENLLPPHSHGYEEAIVRKLKDGPKTYADLVDSVPKNSLSRSIQRLMEKGLVSKNKSSGYIFYFRTKKVPKRKFSPTDKKVYEAILEVGVSAKELSEEVDINLRRIYKYLRRLRKRRLVFTRKRSRTYELTLPGRQLANFIEETVGLIENFKEISTFFAKKLNLRPD